MKMLVMTPLAIEKRYLTPHLEGVEVRVGGHGKVAVALATQKAILELDPDLVILAGACGALEPKMRLLDVVVATSTIEHDFKLRFIKRAPPEFAGDARACEVLRAIPGLHFGKIASGDEDVTSRERAREILQETGALVVAWEGAGAARACLMHKTAFLELRAVSDLADANAVSNFTKSIADCMARLARPLAILREFDPR